MSNWDRNYTSYRNQNLYQNAYSNYSNPGRSANYEDWTNYSLTQNNHTPTQHPVTLISSGGGTSSNEGGFVRSEYYPSNVEGSHIFNMDMNSEIWARAASSQLTPTAGEFIPSAMYQSSNNHQVQGSSQSNNSNRFQRNQNSGISMNGEVSSRSNVHSDSSLNATTSETANHPRRNFDKAKSRVTDNRRQLNIEQSKAEGRKKLLQEAAGLNSRHSEPIGSSTSNSVDHSNTKWRSRGYDKAGRMNDSKPFTRTVKSQDQYHQPQRQSPPRKSEAGSSPRKERYHSNNKGVDEAASQRDRLTDQLNRGKLECLVCCELVRQADSVWSCHNCYHVLHLRCTIKWANTSKADNGWRCPACQNVTVAIPKDYYCFCDKVVNPDWNRTDTAHSCGEVCNRPKVLASEHYTCVHRCTLLCHPGPCPPCVALVTRKCGCGKSSQTVQCGQIQPLLCSETCEKPLNCGSHQCADKCHVGDCEPCQIIIKQECHCGKGNRELQCDGKNNDLERFFCGKACEGNLSCGHHTCEQLCHEGPCGTCLRDPAQVTHCPCGKTPLTLEQKRISCLDPIPTCESICEKQLSCGQPSAPHQCKSKCHNGPCPPCDQSTLVRCRCGYMFQEIECTELTTKADDARCQKKCTKKRSCGKHKCNQLCCIDLDHLCPLPCNHMLSCGQHRCDQLCHRGHCQSCLRSSFEELYCECGNSVLLPPIPCGTKPPPCNKPCSRAHDCDHEVLHMCHSFPTCPPCGVLTTRHCHGKHELRKAVPCHMKEFSCGLPCSRALPCGRHKCIQPCHNGECNTSCRQPCTKPRELCGHPCNAPCHDGECIDSPCKESVAVTCECGHRSMSRPCFENNSEYQRIATSLLASKMADVQLGRSVNLADMQGPKKISIKTLECTEECRLIERNRRLAIGLQIRNPDLSAKLTPRYSDFMRGWAKKDQRFCQLIHDKLTELVKLSKESKQKSRSYSFETMNRDKRQFVHEYCTHFGCESVAYDAEPKRNVVATAQRDKAWLPSYSLLEVVQREMGQRKVPLPNLNSSSQKAASQSNALPVRVALNQPSKPQLPPEPIDYFDYNG